MKIYNFQLSRYPGAQVAPRLLPKLPLLHKPLAHIGVSYRSPLSNPRESQKNDYLFPRQARMAPRPGVRHLPLGYASTPVHGVWDLNS